MTSFFDITFIIISSSSSSSSSSIDIHKFAQT